MKLCRQLLLVAAMFLAVPASANNVHIMAEVNGEAITNIAVEGRMRLIMATTKVPETPSAINRLKRHALQTLINETIQYQYASDSGIRVFDREIKAAIASLEKQNKLPEGGFTDHLQAMEVPKESAIGQVKAQILWQKIIANKVRPKIQLSDFEIEDAIYQISERDKDKKEVFLSEILLKSDASTNEETIKLANELIEQFKNGTSFGETAQQLSVAKSNQNSGVLGWVPIDQLAKNIREKAMEVAPNTILPPMASTSGDYVRILKIGNIRATSSNIEAERDRIKNYLTSRNIEKESQRLMKELRYKSFVEFR